MNEVVKRMMSNKKITLAAELRSKNKTIDSIELLMNLLKNLFYSTSCQETESEENKICGQLEEIERILVILLKDYCRDELQRKKVVSKFLNKLPDICRLVTSDVEAAYAGDPAAADYEEIILAYPGPYAIMVQRVSHILYQQKVPILPRMMTEYAHSMTGIDIHPGADIGESFFIDHGTGVVIGETASIGRAVKIYQGVTLGALSTSGGQKLRNQKRHPTVEDFVTIYAGTSVLGGNTVVGAHSVIGSNVFITESVPENTRIRLDNENRNVYLLDERQEERRLMVWNSAQN